jgi:hypothetical protein
MSNNRSDEKRIAADSFQVIEELVGKFLCLRRDDEWRDFVVLGFVANDLEVMETEVEKADLTQSCE